MFNLLKNRQTVFQCDCTVLHSYQQQMRVPVSPHPCQNLLLSVFSLIVILVDVKVCLVVVFIFSSLLTNDVEHPFMCRLAIYYLLR